MIIYTDGSFKSKHQPKDINLVKFISAFLVIGTPSKKEYINIEDVFIPRSPNLECYSNLAEFIAIKLAILYAIDKGEKNVIIYTDSKVCISWINHIHKGYYKNNKGFATIQHWEIFNSLLRYKNKIDIKLNWVPRDNNLMGIILDEI